MKKLKHNHKGTKIIKLSLFASMMFAPILAVLFKCSYVTFNKNAYLSYYGDTINETTYTNNLSSLNVNKDYELNITEMPSSQQTSQFIYVDSISNLQGIPTTSNYYNEILNASAFSLYYNSNLNSYSLRYIYNSETKYYGFATVPSNALSPFTFNFVISADYQNTNTDLQKYIYEMTYNKYSYLDNAFEYSINQLEESNLFNWTKTAALYTPTQAMTSGMGIQTDSIAMIITYWMYITAIYIVIDIVVELFTYITHTITGRLETD